VEHVGRAALLVTFGTKLTVATVNSGGILIFHCQLPSIKPRRSRTRAAFVIARDPDCARCDSTRPINAPRLVVCASERSPCDRGELRGGEISSTEGGDNRPLAAVITIEGCLFLPRTSPFSTHDWTK